MRLSNNCSVFEERKQTFHTNMNWEGVWQRASKGYKCLEGFDNFSDLLSVWGCLSAGICIHLDFQWCNSSSTTITDHWNKSRWLVEYRVFQIQHNNYYDSWISLNWKGGSAEPPNPPCLYAPGIEPVLEVPALPSLKSITKHERNGLITKTFSKSCW